MKKSSKKILIGIALLISIIAIGYNGLVSYVLYTFNSGCGMDDGPFKAILIDEIELSQTSEKYDLSNNGKLILENRNDTLSPIIALIEHGEIKWTLDTDTRNTKGYESTRIWKLSDITIIKDSNPIKIRFIGHWTYGAEVGSMEIDRKNGQNNFCLSW